MWMCSVVLFVQRALVKKVAKEWKSVKWVILFPKSPKNDLSRGFLLRFWRILRFGTVSRSLSLTKTELPGDTLYIVVEGFTIFHPKNKNNYFLTPPELPTPLFLDMDPAEKTDDDLDAPLVDTELLAIKALYFAQGMASVSYFPFLNVWLEGAAGLSRTQIGIIVSAVIWTVFLFVGSSVNRPFFGNFF